MGERLNEPAINPSAPVGKIEHEDRPRHNHMTRDIKAKGQCPRCDEYHESQEAKSDGKD